MLLSGFEIDVEDTVTTMFDYRDKGRPLPVSLNLSFIQKPTENMIIFRCETGTISWDLGTGVTSIENTETGEQGEHGASGLVWNDLFVAEMQHFIDCSSLNELRQERGLSKLWYPC